MKFKNSQISHWSQSQSAVFSFCLSGTKKKRFITFYICIKMTLAPYVSRGGRDGWKDREREGEREEEREKERERRKGLRGRTEFEWIKVWISARAFSYIKKMCFPLFSFASTLFPQPWSNSLNRYCGARCARVCVCVCAVISSLPLTAQAENTNMWAASEVWVNKVYD